MAPVNSSTAMAVNMGRAMANELGMVEDIFAAQCLPEAVARAICQPRRHSLRSRLYRFWAHCISDMMGPRTRVIDEWLEGHCRPQVVLLGAGFDARAHRLSVLKDSVVFEVDLPVIQAHKKRLAESWPVISQRLMYVAADVSERSLTENLQRSGFQFDVPTFWLAEGLVSYLTEEAVQRLLKQLAALSVKDSVLCLTYNEDSFSRRLVSAATSLRGEPQKFYDSRVRMSQRLASVGLEVMQDLDGMERARCVRGKTTLVDTVWSRFHRLVLARWQGEDSGTYAVSEMVLSNLLRVGPLRS